MRYIFFLYIMGIKDGFNKMDFLMCLQSEKFGNINQYKSLSPPTQFYY